ncbi:ASF1 like histone chaperone-domain-containing protein [Pavlovales sp. CCMP2436]|nr:ASF1 like histone chaperone-domain-containing protein [Pavlovales sp. CCMP2436]|mmetsp:Transcript_21123/g.49381  ORF Transcript_21123/g.49381 Transcript_21123/m.49381 type:complete len:208 (+) Transcript_21123:727-1350(+)
MPCRPADYTERLPACAQLASDAKTAKVAMAYINVTGVQVLDNPASFKNPLQFEISFECLAALSDEIEWKVTYVGSAKREKFYQELNSVLVGPINVGSYKIVVQADAPNPSKIPHEDLLDVTTVILSCHYREKELMHVSYLVSNEYDDPELRDNPPKVLLLDRVVRNVRTATAEVLFVYNVDANVRLRTDGIGGCRQPFPSQPVEELR